MLTRPLPCVECGSAAALVSGEAIYPTMSRYWARLYWRCPAPCGAYVGCHPGTRAPLGAPAGPYVRRLRNDLHAVFDLLWKHKILRDGTRQHVARQLAYAWLARELGIPVQECHIAWMGADMARRALEICRAARRPGAAQPASLMGVER